MILPSLLAIMAWYCIASSNIEMVNHLTKSGIIQTQTVAQGMKLVDRAKYVVDGTYPYTDSPQPIGFGQTISAPHMHAYALEELNSHIMTSNSKILDVGSGSGYLCAVMARMNPEAKVVGIEYFPELAHLGEKNIEKADGDLLHSGRVRLVHGDGWAGYAAEGPYDAIHVGAGATSVPRALLHQLKLHGRLVIPVGANSAYQELLRIDRVKGEPSLSAHASAPDMSDFVVKTLMDVRFVPLIGKRN